MTLRAGAARVNITPPNGYPFSAWGLRTGVAVVAVDLCNTARQFTDEVRQRVQALTSIPPEAVMINASHTHSGPPGVPARSGVSLGSTPSAYEGYASALPDLVAGAAFSAWYNRRPAKVGAGMGHAPGITTNRVHKDDPKDEQVGVLRVDGEDGQPIATVA